MKARLLTTLIAGALLTPLLAAAQEVTLRVHHWASPRSNQHAGALVPWCEKVMKDSANRIKCDVFPAMQLGGAPAQLQHRPVAADQPAGARCHGQVDELLVVRVGTQERVYRNGHRRDRDVAVEGRQQRNGVNALA